MIRLSGRNWHTEETKTPCHYKGRIGHYFILNYRLGDVNSSPPRGYVTGFNKKALC